jgi:hypothetical protein
MSETLTPFIRFFHERRDLLRGADVVADVAVLRSFPSQVFADSDYARLTYRAEQALIENRIGFQIIYDHHLDDLTRYRALVLSGCVALSDEHVKLIRRYVESGGGLCIIGPAATHDEWMQPRENPPWEDLPARKVVRIKENSDIMRAVRRACGQKLSLSVQAQHGLCSELTEQPGRRLVHLVNYRADDPVEDVSIRLRVPDVRRIEAITLVGPERENDLELEFQEQADRVTFRVPQVDTYEIAVVTMH